MSSDAGTTKTRILVATWNLLESNQGQGVSMGDIAKAAGLSRQAVYLHFASRTELMIATSNYVDEMKGLDARLAHLSNATTGVDLLETCVEIWGNYIPEIYGLAKALMRNRDTDKAMAAAWDGNMRCLRDICQETIETLDREGNLRAPWTQKEAVEIFWTMISISNWEQFTVECGWSTPEYIARMKTLLKRTFVATSA